MSDKTGVERSHDDKDCPVGKVQIAFVGCSPAKRRSNYGWEPVDHAFIEVYVDGQWFCIDVGKVIRSDGSTRRGLHIVGHDSIEVDHHSVNAVDIMLPTSAVAPHDPKDKS